MVVKKWLTHLVITGYIGALAWGLVSHTFEYKNDSHPAMYYIVWDMFCGWGSYSNRVQVIAEGESGEFYEVTPAPWGSIKPFGKLDRRHYDFYGLAINRIAMNVLKHTRHEPITRVYVLDECWPKKFNIPDSLWNARYAEDKDPYHYFYTRYVIAGDGALLEQYPNWFEYQQRLVIGDNPRLVRDVKNARPMYSVSPLQFNRDPVSGSNAGSGGQRELIRNPSYLGN